MVNFGEGARVLVNGKDSVVNCKESINNHQNLKFVVHSDFIESDDSFEARTDR